jgi:hypothetical protein
MKKRSFIILMVTFLSGCVSNPPLLVPDSEGKEYISAIGMTCSKPYVLENDCSGFSGPTKKLLISEVEIKMAGSEDGKVIVIFGGKSHGTQAETANIGYELVKKELYSNNIEITNTRPIVSANILFGYALETDKAAYALFDKYAE